MYSRRFLTPLCCCSSSLAPIATVYRLALVHQCVDLGWYARLVSDVHAFDPIGIIAWYRAYDQWFSSASPRLHTPRHIPLPWGIPIVVP